MQWTKAQSDAINVSRRDVLVAAAAGSGKTATLTERVLEAICRDEDPVDISRLLIVTFTEKAAEELKIRIRKKLQAKAQAEPDNARIRKQLSLLPAASISTIHSFYIKVLREGFSELGLPPKLRVADEGAVEIIRHRVMNDVIDEYYDNAVEDEYAIEDAEGFFDTFERIRPGNDLYKALCDLYDDVSSYPEFLDFYKNCEQKYREYAADFGKSEHFAYFVSSAEKRFSVILDGFERLEAEFADDKEFQNKYRHAALYCEDVIRRALALLAEADYEKLYGFFSQKLEIPNAKPVKGEAEFKDKQKALRLSFVNEYGFAAKILSFSPEDVKTICEKTSAVCGCIYKVLSRFEKGFSAEKLSAGTVDFNDMERLAHRLICRTDKGFAKKIAAKYDEIYVDEYQDVNGIQDEIFSAISKNDRFMVGDVKQSIYSFRGADPTLFSSYRRAFKPYDGKTADPSVIFLSSNFRCGKRIIDFTNEVFRTVFGTDERIPYSKEDELVYGKDRGENVPVKFTVFEGGNTTDEAEYAAKEIRKLLKEGSKDDGSPLTLSDIAVLCRSSSACATVEKTFSAYGLGCVNGSDKTFFDSPEVLLAVSILSAVDNPISDVQLAAAMKSPVFGFTLDELAKIRMHSPSEPLYSALRSYADETGDEKCVDFIKTLSYLRYRSRSMPTDKFIRLLYKETRLLSVVYNESDKKDPADRRGNLILLYELARRFESDSFKGLYGFISYCKEMIERGTSFAAASDPAGKITVQTIHGSKGLEYPVCFIIGAGSKFNSDYTKERTVSDRRLGIGVRVKTDGGAVMTGPIYNIGVMKKTDDLITDEACLLYVAMTRAQKYLYITASSAKEPVFAGGGAPCYGCASFLDLLEASLDGAGDSYEYAFIRKEEKETAQTAAGRRTEPVKECFDGDGDYEKLKEIYGYEYPYKEAAELPKKAAVSKLYPKYLDTDDEAADVFGEDGPIALILPDYAGTEKEASAAQKGTSTHLFMQFCDFDKAEADARAEARRLVEKGFIKKENEELISYKEVETFFRSDLYKRMKNARESGRLFFREYRFNVELDAADFTKDEQRKKALSEEKLLVQGVIDCFFEEEDGGVTVVDYKTDRLNGSPGSVEEFKERHRLQLSYYRSAVERIALTPVKKCELYSFCLGRSEVL